MAESWEDVLARLEEDLDGAARQLRGSGDPALAGWAPPSFLGPIPEQLIGRALAVQERQRRLATRLAEAKDDAARHLAAVSSVPLGRGGGALYLDVEG
ncbi:hypothetical protein SPF06_20630 [Sinomonas sp. JGH33]|uniref:Flagellar protein FlgN n=1 Tax=Sinomonas terricola TaxID=3110330 RepID=A0ABU5TC02_9MICC|nr:hypothetical protein [Sinomonas sp. JGH33]MEA5457133.1 hypothetical protein [Sinomonas sp. JGH33]